MKKFSSLLRVVLAVMLGLGIVSCRKIQEAPQPVPVSQGIGNAEMQALKREFQQHSYNFPAFGKQAKASDPKIN